MQGDGKAAIAQFDRIRRMYFGQPEALAATIFHGDLVRPDSPRSRRAYKRALSQVTGGDEAYNNTWLPADEFRAGLSAAIDDLAEREAYAEALELAEALVAPFSHIVAVERQADIHRAWAQQLSSGRRMNCRRRPTPARLRPASTGGRPGAVAKAGRYADRFPAVSR